MDETEQNPNIYAKFITILLLKNNHTSLKFNNYTFQRRINFQYVLSSWYFMLE